MTAATKPVRLASTPRRGLSRVEAAVYVGFSLNRFNELLAAGRMPQPREFEGAQVWDVRELDIYFDALPRAEGPARRGNYFRDE